MTQYSSCFHKHTDQWSILDYRSVNKWKQVKYWGKKKLSGTLGTSSAEYDLCVAFTISQMTLGLISFMNSHKIWSSLPEIIKRDNKLNRFLKVTLLLTPTRNHHCQSPAQVSLLAHGCQYRSLSLNSVDESTELYLLVLVAKLQPENLKIYMFKMQCTRYTIFSTFLLAR